MIRVCGNIPRIRFLGFLRYPIKPKE